MIGVACISIILFNKADFLFPFGNADINTFEDKKLASIEIDLLIISLSASSNILL